MFRTCVILASALLVAGQAPIPNNVDSLGYLMTSNPKLAGGVEIEIFGDYQCPDTRDAWNNVLFPLLGWLKEKQNPSSIVFHPFPLPYHFNSFTATMAADVAVKYLAKDLNIDTTIAFEKVAIEFFKFQDNFQNNATASMTVAQVWKQVYWPIVQAAGMPASQEASFLSQATSVPLDQFVRVPWKFGCALGISGTPAYMVNRVVSDAAASWNLAQWQQFILSHSK
eukprot:TRINITY_DN2979_c0_g1_i2.p2 TRINITY_DN2979_c0_g1~~TRINITY_DN2979_c0_g1_i2.p2  ORF type:complete len:225 (+),score=49.44 TRINITY_DN2979_c0_g1_i2:59-733(+)